MSPVIAVDLGATNLRVAYFKRQQPEPAELVKLPTHPAEGPDAVIARMIEAIDGLLPANRKNLRIGVGSPGPLDPFRGIILDTPNMPGWKEVSLRQILADRFACPVVLDNDANLAALAEWKHGAARGTMNMVYLTLSTGIGGGVIVDGKLLRGAQGLAGELGHMAIEAGGALCGCGRQGHVEALASGPAIARLAQARLEAGEMSLLVEMLEEAEVLTAAAVGLAARKGDALAREVLEEAGSHIGRHLANLTHAFNPEAIVLGGGVSRIGELIFEPIERAIHASVMHPAFVEGLRLLPAKLGDSAGLVGAMVLANQA